MLKEYINNFIIVYFNTIIIFLKDITKYNKYIKKVIMKLIDTRIILSIKKYNFNITKIHYLKIVIIIRETKFHN